MKNKCTFRKPCNSIQSEQWSRLYPITPIFILIFTACFDSTPSRIGLIHNLYNSQTFLAKPKLWYSDLKSPLQIQRSTTTRHEHSITLRGKQNPQFLFSLFFSFLLICVFQLNFCVVGLQGAGAFSGFTRLCKGLAVVLIGGHIVVQFLPQAVNYLALIPARFRLSLYFGVQFWVGFCVVGWLLDWRLTKMNSEIVHKSVFPVMGFVKLLWKRMFLSVCFCVDLKLSSGCWPCFSGIGIIW